MKLANIVCVLRKPLATLLGLLLASPLACLAGQEAIPLAAVSAGTYYVKASLDRLVETDMLLDTGSGYVSLTHSTFEHIKHEPGTVFQRYIKGVMADGKALKVPVYSIAELKLSEHCVLYDIEVAVFRNATRDILGLSALRQMQPITLQLEPPLLTANCG